jgi:glycosyltransferase involved in cell wall biosynthesis
MTASSIADSPVKPLKLVFIHLDLGIGGAEQLVLQLARAGQDNGHEITLVTTRCDPDHCFAAVAPGGPLHSNLRIYGNWIPPQLFGAATAIMSTLRIFYLTWQVCRRHRDADVCVVDVLPTSLPLLYWMLPSAATFFYCHFPDQLLLRTSAKSSLAKRIYRGLLDALEEYTMATADLMVVNSKFTREVVLNTFSSFRHDNITVPVLYPALDTSSTSTKENVSLQPKTIQSPIVSLNRFERKKNILLLLHAYHYLKKTYPDQVLPPLIVAGGYDVKNVENVEYRGELQRVVKDELKIQVEFRTDISDVDRATLFQTALTVVYTPHMEHFGIVPLEAMYAGTPVLAVKSGGPMETIVDGQTGFLREPSPDAFGEALLELIRDPSKATAMGRAGKLHVEANFGTERLAREFQALLQDCQKRQRINRPNYALWSRTGDYFVDAFYAILFSIALTAVLKFAGILHADESLIGGIRRTLYEGEL